MIEPCITWQDTGTTRFRTRLFGRADVATKDFGVIYLPCMGVGEVHQSERFVAVGTAHVTIPLHANG